MINKNANLEQDPAVLMLSNSKLYRWTHKNGSSTLINTVTLGSLFCSIEINRAIKKDTTQSGWQNLATVAVNGKDFFPLGNILES